MSMDSYDKASLDGTKKRLHSSTNGGGDPNKKIRSTHGRSRKHDPSRLRDSGRVLKSVVVCLKASPSDNISTGVVGIATATVDRQVDKDVDVPNVGNKMKDGAMGEEFGDLLARLNRVGPFMQERLKEYEESIVRNNEEILKLKNELQKEKTKASQLQCVADECQQRADACNKEKESALLRENLVSLRKDEEILKLKNEHDEEILKLKNELKEEKAKASQPQRVADECQQRADAYNVEKESSLLRENLVSLRKDEVILKLKNELQEEKTKAFQLQRVADECQQRVDVYNEEKESTLLHKNPVSFRKDEEILKLKNELQEEKAKASRFQRVADECQQRAYAYNMEKESALLRENLLSCELNVLKPKYVDKVKRIDVLKRELESANKVSLGKHDELEEEIEGLRETMAHLSAHNATLQKLFDDVHHDRQWLITEGFSYVFDKLRKSVEFLKPYDIVRSLLLQSKFQDGMRVGHDLCSHGLGVDVVPGYDPDFAGKLSCAIDDLDTLVFPYLRVLAANADESLDVIRAIAPDGVEAS